MNTTPESILPDVLDLIADLKKRLDDVEADARLDRYLTEERFKGIEDDRRESFGAWLFAASEKYDTALAAKKGAAHQRRLAHHQAHRDGGA